MVSYNPQQKSLGYCILKIVVYFILISHSHVKQLVLSLTGNTPSLPKQC